MAKLSNFVSSVEVPSGISPINDKDFPILDAHSIQTTEEGERLDTSLENIKQVNQQNTTDINTLKEKTCTVEGETLIIKI